MLPPVEVAYVLLPALLLAITYGTACGVERWHVKTLMDMPSASLSSKPVDTTVHALSALVAPSHPEDLTDRKAPLETTLWRVRARLMGYKLEPDSDFHVILADPQTGETMTGEIPAAFCTSSPHAADFSRARHVVESIGGRKAARRWWWLDYHGATAPLVTIEGVGFWDLPHKTTGSARNFAEIHPILSVAPL